jgi:hypothetical protein
MTTNEAEYLFVRTYEDLQQLIKSKDDYGILKTSGLLRKLLLDMNPLIHQANRRLQQKIV